MEQPKNIPRRQAIPILYVRGTHYDVGFDMGRTFSSVIKHFLELSNPLNKCYIPLYKTQEGKEVYKSTLSICKKTYPQYVRELEGIADGAEVEFYKLFLLHLDEILPQAAKNIKVETCPWLPIGCSTIFVNRENTRILAHTEDALTETLNHYYFVVAHIKYDDDETKEERFMSLCYAGHLPGYTMNYNHHGLVFSINTLSAEHLRSGKIPRHFITRALLSAENYDEAISILKNPGTADGCSINIAFLRGQTDACFNIEMAPAADKEDTSLLDIKRIGVNEYNYHTNKYERLEVKQANEIMLDSSVARMKTFSSYKPPKTRKDVLRMLGDCSDRTHCVFRENGKPDELVKTIAVGVFDLNAKTVTLYSDNPRRHESQVTLPMILKD